MINKDVSIETRIIELLVKGDEQAFDIVYKKYYKVLFFYASRYVQHADCEEIVQETMMWLWENRTSIVPDLSIHSLLFAITKNKCLNQISRTRIRRKVHSELFENFETQFLNENFFLEIELKTIIENAIANLPKTCKQTFILNRIEGKSYSEIADLLSVSYQTVAYRISQALGILRAVLKDYNL